MTLISSFWLFNVFAYYGVWRSRITNKWIRFGVPLVGCGEWSEVAYGKLQGTVSTYMQSLV